VNHSASVRKILQLVLKHAETPLGRIYEAGDGWEALDVLRSHSVDLVLSAIDMPNMDGLQLLSRIRAEGRWPNARVVMTTAEGNQSRVMEAVSLGAAGYIRRPFTADQIQEKVLLHWAAG
jgi:two-component system chemotaxis response regulator CheY